MDLKIPKRLKKEPLLEAIWELRFKSIESIPVGEILPGILYQAMQKDYPVFTRLPVPDFPPDLLVQNPDLRYMVKVRLESTTTPFIIQIGPQIVSLNCRRPYAGWGQFKNKILELVSVLKNTNLIGHPERLALRYLDLLQVRERSLLSCLRIKIDLAGDLITDCPLHLRTEQHKNSLLHVLQVTSPSVVQVTPDKKETGILVDLDVAYKQPDHIFENMDKMIETLHDASKQRFFELLTEDALKLMEPEY